MAKKKKKKTKSAAKPARPKEQRLEDKLFGYVKKERWGEFVTLFVRQWSRATQTAAAEHWDQAVYNLLARTLFQEQDLRTLEVVLQTLDQAGALSGENERCVAVAKGALSLSQGEGDPEALRQLPRTLPPPFAALRDRLEPILETDHDSPLQEYMSGRRTKARKGEKHFSLIAKLALIFAELQQQGFNPDSITPLTTFRNLFAELHRYLEQSSGGSEPIFRDASVLAEWLRDMKRHPWKHRDVRGEMAFLSQQKFSFSRHPFVIRLLHTAIARGAEVFGGQWALGLGAALQKQYPSLVSVLPEHVEAQIEAWSKALFKERADSLDGKTFVRVLDKLLSHPVWTQRERFVLLLSKLIIINASSNNLFESEYFLFRFHMEIGREAKNLLALSSETFLEAQQIYQDLFPETGKPNQQLLGIWENTLDSLPVMTKSEAYFKVVHHLAGLDLPGSTILHLLSLDLEHNPSSEDHTLLQEISEHRGPMGLSPEEVSTVVGQVQDHPYLTRVMHCWAKCLEPSSQQRVVEGLLLQAFERALDHDDPEDDYLFGSDDEENPWLAFSKDLLKWFLEVVDPRFPLLGLMRLTVNTPGKNLPTPRNAKQAKVFLEDLPPPDYLMKMILWMMSWPKTAHKDRFLKELILKIAGHFTATHSWGTLVNQIYAWDQAQLAPLLWEVWEELGLFAELEDDPDFAEAREDLSLLIQPWLRKKKGKRKPRN